MIDFSIVAFLFSLILEVCVLVFYGVIQFLSKCKQITTITTTWSQDSSCTKSFPYGPDDVVLLMCHGSGVDSEQFIFAKWMLEPYIACETIDFVTADDTTCSLNDYVEQLDRKIRDLGIRKVIFLGVSMGGLICTKWAMNARTKPTTINDPSIQVLGIVTLGTPFQGAPLLKHFATIYNKIPFARWIFRKFRTVRHIEMAPDSPFLYRLNMEEMVQMSDPEKSKSPASFENASHNSNFQSPPMTATSNSPIPFLIPFLTVGSTVDFQVPDNYAVPKLPLRNHEHMRLQFAGHIALSVWIPIFWRVRSFVRKVVTLHNQ